MGYVVRVDDRERIKLPKGFVKPGERVLLITAGKRLILIPIPSRPIEASSSWLRTRLDRRDLRRLAESRALEEVERKLARREKDAHRERCADSSS